MNENDSDVGQKKRELEVPVAWEALEDAFENNAPEVHSYLHFDTGEVIRIVDGVADPAMHTRILNDSRYLRIDPVSSREQYRWMERFIATVDDEELRRRLNIAIDGKGAFRRFKDALMSHPVDRERWFAFRSDRLRACMESWLTAHGIHSVERPKWKVPTAQDVQTEPPAPREERRVRRTAKSGEVDASRGRLHELVDAVAARDVETAEAFLEFLSTRRPSAAPPARAKAPDVAVVPAKAADRESH